MTPSRAPGSLCTVRDLFKNRPVFAWAMYDWANSAFATTVMAGFFPVFFQKFWSTDVTATETTSRLGYGSAIAGAVIAMLAPILGAIADRGGTRKQFMFAWTLLGVGRDRRAVLRGEGRVGRRAHAVRARDHRLQRRHRVQRRAAARCRAARASSTASPRSAIRSAISAAVCCSCVNMLMVQSPALFGLRDSAQAVQVSFVTVAVVVAGVHDSGDARRARTAARPAPRHSSQRHRASGFRELGSTISHLRQYRTLVHVPDRLLVLHRRREHHHQDGGELRHGARARHRARCSPRCWSRSSSGFPAALLFGWLGDRIGPQRGILIGLVVYAGDHGLRVFPDSEREFFVLAMRGRAACRAACRACRVRCSAGWCRRARTPSSSASTT